MIGRPLLKQLRNVVYHVTGMVALVIKALPSTDKLAKWACGDSLTISKGISPVAKLSERYTESQQMSKGAAKLSKCKSVLATDSRHIPCRPDIQFVIVFVITKKPIEAVDA